jgi:hypothetical protein
VVAADSASLGRPMPQAIGEMRTRTIRIALPTHWAYNSSGAPGKHRA